MGDTIRMQGARSTMTRQHMRYGEEISAAAVKLTVIAAIYKGQMS